MEMMGRLTVILVAATMFLLVGTPLAFADPGRQMSPVSKGTLLKTGPGDDYIDAVSDPAAPAKIREDIVRCGSGSDTVEADPMDNVSIDCENVRRVGSSERPAMQLMVTFSCDLNVQQPHYSSQYNQVSAKARLECATDRNQLYLDTELYRWRAWGWQYLGDDPN